MLTKEAVNAVAARMGCYRKDARELLLQHFVSVLTEAAVRGEKVHLAGLGTFLPRPLPETDERRGEAGRVKV
jgi:DNA-binding protein HU-beta